MTALQAALNRLNETASPRHSPLVAAALTYLEELAEELACRDASCAPPPVGTGGSKPAAKSGSKLGVLSSKSTERSAVPQARTSAPRMTMDEVKSIYEVDLGGGVTTNVDDVTQTADKVKVYGTIEFESGGTHTVGRFERTLTTADNGDLVASHDSLRVDPEFHGQGIGTQFTDHTMRMYEEMGVDRIELEAAMSTGPYAWARQGYRFDEDRAIGNSRHEWVSDRLNDISANARRSWDRGEVTDDDYQWLEERVFEVREASRAGEDIQPIHVASIGEGDNSWESRISTSDGEIKMWPGKQALTSMPGTLSEARYMGVYYLESSS